MVGAGGEQSDSDAIPVRSALRPDTEIEACRVDRQITDYGVRDLALDLSAFKLNDLTARAEDDFLEFLEAFDLLRA